MANPHAPAVHMNTRFLATTKRWFGGGADLNPPIPYAEDTADFHAAMKAACDAHDSDHYPRFRKWADEYFYIPHRKVHRGVGGIFYDRSEEHTSELQSLMRISYAVFCLKKKKKTHTQTAKQQQSHINTNYN